MLRQRTPSRLRPENGSNISNQDREWNELLKRRKTVKENFDRIKSELTEATEALQKIGTSKPSIKDFNDFKTSDWKYNNNFKPEKSQSFSFENQRISARRHDSSSFQDSNKSLFNSSVEKFSERSIERQIPSRWEGVERTFSQKIPIDVQQPSSRKLPSPLPPPSSPSLTAPQLYKEVSQSRRESCRDDKTFHSNHSLTTSRDKKSVVRPAQTILRNLRTHEYDRILFKEETCVLFRERYDEKLRRAKTLLTSFDLRVAVSTSQKNLLKVEERNSSFDWSIKNSCLASRTLEKRTLPVASIASKHIWQCPKSFEKVKSASYFESKTELSHELFRPSIAYKDILFDKTQSSASSAFSTSTATATTTSTSTSTATATATATSTATSRKPDKSDYKLNLGILKPEELAEFKLLENKTIVQEEHLKERSSEKNKSSGKVHSNKGLIGKHHRTAVPSSIPTTIKVKNDLKQSPDMFQSEEKHEITKLANNISNISITENNSDGVQNRLNGKESNPGEGKSQNNIQIQDENHLKNENNSLHSKTNGFHNDTKSLNHESNGFQNEINALNNETTGSNNETNCFITESTTTLNNDNNSLNNETKCLKNESNVLNYDKNSLNNENSCLNKGNNGLIEGKNGEMAEIRTKTITVPINLLQRWQTMYKTDFKDADSDSEYEYEEDDPSSPYYTETTLDIEPVAESLEILTNWTKNIVSHEKDFLEELNRKHVSDESWSIVEEKICHPKTREITGLSDVTYCGETRHGFYREFDANGKDVTSFGRYVDGDKVGVVWQRLEGNGFLIDIDDNNNNQETSVYLYPDLTCAISGDFEGGKLKSGKFGKVVGLDFDEVGIPIPKVQTLREDVSFTYDPSMSVCISRSPLVRDPYEHQNVYVANSKIEFAGEGLYAKRFLPAGTLVALFNGIRQRETGFTKKMHEFSDYRIGIGSGEVCLDIPDAYVGLDKYCATTGHKACHSFKPNSGFREFRHPRFGRIMSIVAESDIEPNQEVLVSYNYRIHQAPVWYRELYFQHLREDELLGEEGIYMIARRIMRQHEVTVVIPPPSSDSPRFVACGVCRQHVGYDDCAVACGRCEKWTHVRCTPLKVEDIFDEDQSGNKIPKNTEWHCQLCIATS